MPEMEEESLHQQRGWSGTVRRYLNISMGILSTKVDEQIAMDQNADVIYECDNKHRTHNSESFIHYV